MSNDQLTMVTTASPTASRILIADDNQQNCELLEAYLSNEGFEIKIVFDGQETLARIAECHPTCCCSTS